MAAHEHAHTEHDVEHVEHVEHDHERVYGMSSTITRTPMTGLDEEHTRDH